MSRFYSPLRYPGGKNIIFPFILELLKENNLIWVQYAEPYAGGAGLALRLLINNYVEQIYINDFDRSIYAFWVAVLEHTDNFCNWINGVEISMDNWFLYKEIHQNSLNTESLFDLAKATFFLNRTNVSGIIKGGVIGGKKQKGRYKINARFNKTDLISRIQKIANFKQKIHVSNIDGLEFVRKINQTKQNIFLYIDPPYVQKGAELYMNYYSNKEHQDLAQLMYQTNKKWLISYDNNKLIRELYDKSKMVSYKLSYSASNNIGDELLVFSCDLKFKNAIKLLRTI